MNQSGCWRIDGSTRLGAQATPTSLRAINLQELLQNACLAIVPETIRHSQTGACGALICRTNPTHRTTKAGLGDSGEPRSSAAPLPYKICQSTQRRFKLKTMDVLTVEETSQGVPGSCV